MAHHKRKRPKHQRAGCLACKPWKDERGGGKYAVPARAGDVRRMQATVSEGVEETKPAPLGCGSCASWCRCDPLPDWRDVQAMPDGCRYFGSIEPFARS